MRFVRRAYNFWYALKGLEIAWREEFNFKVHVVFAVAAPLLGWYLGISKTEFLIVILLIGLVMTAEIFNTALEELCDKFQPEHDPHIAKIKDLAAAAVLVSSIAALIVGLAIYLPYFSAWIPLEVVDGV
ncbi:diacylglycerol kinase family protein [Candidatus Parcubacteria bacterium]|nr:MAG: diacylglycerol kinase family protein [Candidatus Parcubacteria bacterium]